MPRIETSTLVYQEAQTSNTSVYKKKLPEKGYLSGIDLRIRVQNGSTSAINMFLTDAIKKIEVIRNGTDRIFSLTGDEAFKQPWMKFGRPPEYTFDATGSAYQMINFPIRFGRYLGDPQYFLDLGKYNSVNLEIDYDMTLWGAVAATTFTTGTFEPSLVLHSFPQNRSMVPKGFIQTREIENYTSVASGNKDMQLPSQNPISAISLFGHEDAIEDGTDVTQVVIGRDSFKERWIDGYWTHLADACNRDVWEKILHYKAYVTAAQNLDTHVNRIRTALARGDSTSWASGATDGVINDISPATIAGNRVTLAGNTVTLANGAATTQTQSALATKAGYIDVTGYPSGVLRFPFGDPGTLDGCLMPSELKDAYVRFVQGGAGAYLATVVEEIVAS